MSLNFSKSGRSGITRTVVILVIAVLIAVVGIYVYGTNTGSPSATSSTESTVGSSTGAANEIVVAQQSLVINSSGSFLILQIRNSGDSPISSFGFQFSGTSLTSGRIVGGFWNPSVGGYTVSPRQLAPGATTAFTDSSVKPGDLPSANAGQSYNVNITVIAAGVTSTYEITVASGA